MFPQLVREQGLNFSQHLKREHNAWNYIYFFIYLRRTCHKGTLSHALRESIAKEDFQFLRQASEHL